MLITLSIWAFLPFVSGCYYFLFLSDTRLVRNSHAQKLLTLQAGQVGNLGINLMIAIVDDDKGVRVALERLVRSVGHNASAFGSAEDFLRSKALHGTSCVITDVQMPGLTGLDLQDRLTAQGHRVPVVFITAHSDESVRARAMKAGAVAFLHKPVDAQHLIKCIETALANKAA